MPDKQRRFLVITHNRPNFSKEYGNVPNKILNRAVILKKELQKVIVFPNNKYSSHPTHIYE